MRRLTNFIRCVFPGKNYRDYYSQLDREQLIRARQNLWKFNVIPAIGWAVAILIVAWSKPDQPEITMLFITLGGFMIITEATATKKRQRLIQQELDRRH